MVRLYYNSSEPGKKPWSLDGGKGTYETTVDVVTIEACGMTRVDLNETDPTKPRAWIEFADGELALGRREDKIIALISEEV